MSETHAELLKRAGVKTFDYGCNVLDVGHGRVKVEERQRTRKEKRHIDQLRQLRDEAKSLLDRTGDNAAFKRALKIEYESLEWSLNQILAPRFIVSDSF